MEFSRFVAVARGEICGEISMIFLKRETKGNEILPTFRRKLRRMDKKGPSRKKTLRPTPRANFRWQTSPENPPSFTVFTNQQTGRVCNKRKTSGQVGKPDKARKKKLKFHSNFIPLEFGTNNNVEKKTSESLLRQKQGLQPNPTCFAKVN